jgi:hypothetical protein
MPATSEKQKKFMDAVAHNASFAKKAGVPQSVGKDFSEASKGMKFGSGDGTRADRQVVNQPKTDHGAAALFKKGGSMTSKMAMFEKSGKDVEKKGMKEGSKADMAMDKKQMSGMKKGGMPMKMKDGKKVPAFMNKGGAAKKMAMGGSASSRADGVATKGKTKGKMLNKGGMAKGKC